MSKLSYPALLESGFHDMECHEIKKICVDAFPSSKRRGMLYQNLSNLLDSFCKINAISYCISEIWVDGSFTTNKPEPDDIDILVVTDYLLLNQVPQQYHGMISQFFDRNFVKLNYNIDVLLLYKNHPNPNFDYDSMRSYWRGWFGFDREETPKGLVRIKL